MESQTNLLAVNSKQDLTEMQRKQLQYQTRGNCVYICFCSQATVMDKPYFLQHLHQQHNVKANKLSNDQFKQNINVYEYNGMKIFYLDQKLRESLQLDKLKNDNEKLYQNDSEQFFQCFCESTFKNEAQLKLHIKQIHKQHAQYFFTILHQRYLNALEKSLRSNQKQCLYYQPQIMRNYIYKKKIGKNKFAYQLQYFNVNKKIEEIILQKCENLREFQRNNTNIWGYIFQKLKVKKDKLHIQKNYSLNFLISQFINSKKNSKQAYLVSRFTLKGFITYLNNKKLQEISQQMKSDDEIYLLSSQNIVSIEEAKFILQTDRQKIIEFILSLKNVIFFKLKKEDISSCIQEFIEELNQINIKKIEQSLFSLNMQKKYGKKYSNQSQISPKIMNIISDYEMCGKKITQKERKIPRLQYEKIKETKQQAMQKDQQLEPQALKKQQNVYKKVIKQKISKSRVFQQKEQKEQNNNNKLNIQLLAIKNQLIKKRKAEINLVQQQISINQIKQIKANQQQKLQKIYKKELIQQK